MFSKDFNRCGAYFFWGIFGYVCYLVAVGGPHNGRFGIIGSVFGFSLGMVVGHFAMKLWDRI